MTPRSGVLVIGVLQIDHKVEFQLKIFFIPRYSSRNTKYMVWMINLLNFVKAVAHAGSSFSNDVAEMLKMLKRNL